LLDPVTIAASILELSKIVSDSNLKQIVDSVATLEVDDAGK
jgi:uncharacterized protein (DUF2336 family)